MAMSLVMFLYGAFGSLACAPPGRYDGFGANSSVHGPDRVVAECVHTPREVAAQTLSPAKRSALMVVDSSSAPPTRPPGENSSWRGARSAPTPVPTYEGPPGLGPPVADHTRP